jgi:16S rRNA (uracil1498-N3)-methyltransferase
MLKSDKLEWVWQKATELGVTTLVPVISKRTVARPGRELHSKQARWDVIVREAAEQCGRGRLPVVAPSCNFPELLEIAPGIRLLPWEEEETGPSLLHAVTHGMQPIDALSLLIGPEGGLEASEVAQARRAGWQVVSLGKRILRADTAALAALAVVTAALGELGSVGGATVNEV